MRRTADVERAYERGWSDGRKRGQVYDPRCDYTVEERCAYRKGFTEGQDEKIRALHGMNQLALREIMP